MVCGGELIGRPREELEVERGHVRYLLEQIDGWEVPSHVRAAIRGRYERQERVLCEALGEPIPALVEEAPDGVRVLGVEPRPDADRATSRTSVAEAADLAGPVASAAESGRSGSRASAAAVLADTATGAAMETATWGIVAAQTATAAEPARARSSEGAAAHALVSPTVGAGVSASSADESASSSGRSALSPDEPIIEALPVGRGAPPPEAPPKPPLPVFERPEPQTPTRRAVEAVSTWNTVWKPFLYEGIFWFLGAVLILAGTFYFVAESWSGLGSISRALVVFAVAAAYSAAFGVGGAMMARKPRLMPAGRALGAIGAAVAPIAAIALTPMAGEAPVLLAVLASLWAVGAAVLAARPARAWAAPIAFPLQAIAGLSTLVVGLAPLAHASHAVWWAAAPALLMWLAPSGSARERPGFAIAAPAFLVGLAVARLSVATGQVAAASWAPVLALFSAGALRWLEGSAAAGALELCGIALECGLVAICWPNPEATLACAGVLCFGAGRASRRTEQVSWSVLTYLAALVALAAVPHLAGLEPLAAAFSRWVAPGLLAQTAWLGLLFATAVALGSARGAGKRAEQWLAIASFGAVGCGAVLAPHAGRPCAGLALALAAGTLFFVGWRRDRALPIVGASLLTLATPIAVWPVEPHLAAAIFGAVALALAALAGSGRKVARSGPSLALVVLASLAALEVLLRGPGPLLSAELLAPVVLALGWTGVRLPSPEVLLFAGAQLALLAVVVLPLPPPLSLALAGALLAGTGAALPRFSSWRGGGVVATLAAIGWAVWLQQAGPLHPLAPELLLAAAACLLASAEERELRPVAVVFAAAAALPPCDWPLRFVPWSQLRPEHSLIAFALFAAAAFALEVWRGRSATTQALAASALVGTTIALIVAGEPSSAFFAIAALTGLISVRPLRPGLSVTWLTLLTTVWALTFWESPSTAVKLGGALGFTALALFDLAPGLRRILFGERPIATLSACGAALLGLVLCASVHAPWVAAVPLLLCLAWVRASRHAFFVAFGLLLCCVSAGMLGHPNLLLELALAFAVLVSRGVHHLPGVRRRLLGSDEERPSRALEAFALWSAAFGATLLSAVWAVPMHGFALVAALVLGAAEWLPLRLIVIALLGLGLLPNRPEIPALLLPFGIALRLSPARCARWLGAKVGSRTPELASVAAVLSALGLALATHRPEAFALLAAALASAGLVCGVEVLFAAAVPLGALAFFGAQRPGGSLLFTPVREEAAAALLSLLALATIAWRDAGVAGFAERIATRLSPRKLDLERALWIGVAAGLAGGVAIAASRPLPQLALGLGLIAAAALVFTRSKVRIAVAVVLAAALAAVGAGHAWAGGAAAGVGLLFGLASFLRGESEGDVQLEASLGVAVLSALLLLHLTHPAVLVVASVIAVLSWLRVVRHPEFEQWAWWISALCGHVALIHLGAVYSTGKPEAFVLPYAGAVTALIAALALLRTARPGSRAGLGLAGVSLIELSAAVLLIQGVAHPEAIVGLCAVALLVPALVRWALRKQEPLAGYLAEAALVIGYLIVRRHAQGAELGRTDALASIVAGALLIGVFGWAQKSSGAGAVLRGPARLGAYLLPALGMTIAFAEDARVTAMLLVGTAAHYAALASRRSERKTAALLSAAAFNLALFVAWRGSHAGELEFYVLPAGLSLLVLVRLFRDELGEQHEARLRAIAITFIYAASAWRPLMFPTSAAFFLCLVVCLLGVAAGIALRIRSYVYLGSAFLVTSVIANLVRYGTRDHRLGAAFLSALGLSVLGTMILFSARREEMVRRYQKMRDLLSSWDA